MKSSKAVVQKQIATMLSEGYSQYAARKFIELSIRTGKINVSEATEILQSIPLLSAS